MRPLAPVTAAAALAVLCATVAPAAAQYGGLQPTLGTTRVGDLRPQLEAYYARNQPGPPISAPAWLITPSIGVDVGVTDNANRVSAPKQADIFTIITPSVTVSREAPRLRLNASYSPSYTVYVSSGRQSGLSQTGNIQALATLVPDAVFLDVRGSASVSSLSGTGVYSQANTASYGRQNQVQTYTFSISPYAQHRFGSWGVGRAGYSFLRTLQDLADDRQQGVQTVDQFGQPGYATTGNLTTQSERASFTSGENFGRFSDTAFVQATQYSGSGSYRGAHNNEAQNQLGFALTRKVTLLAGVGYQDLAYSGTPSYRLQEPTYNTGVRYTPNPDSSVTVLYGRRDGSSSVSFDAQFAPTARTRVFGRYSTGITSDLQDAQSVLEAASVGSGAGLTDASSGAPITSNTAGGTQNGIYRVRRLSLSGLLLRDRDSYSLSVSSEDRTTLTSSTSLLTNGVVPAGTSTSSLSASLSWQHDLAPDISTQVTGSYATSNSTSQLVTGTGGQQRTITLSAGLSKQFTQTLTGTARYVYTDQSGGTGSNATVFNPVIGRTFNTGAYTENLFLVGLRKSF